MVRRGHLILAATQRRAGKIRPHVLHGNEPIRDCRRFAQVVALELNFIYCNRRSYALSSCHVGQGQHRALHQPFLLAESGGREVVRFLCIRQIIGLTLGESLLRWYRYINRVPRLGLFAKVDICAGDELTYNYAMKWFGDPQFAQRCHCLSENCTGFLGPPPRPQNGN